MILLLLLRADAAYMDAVCFLSSCSVSLAFSSGTILRRSSEKPPNASSAVSCNMHCPLSCLAQQLQLN